MAKTANRWFKSHFPDPHKAVGSSRWGACRSTFSAQENKGRNERNPNVTSYVESGGWSTFSTSRPASPKPITL
jgi:hypothetical protein